METVVAFVKENYLMVVNYALNLGVIWAVLSKGNELIKEVGDVLVTYIEAAEDKKITAEEVAKLGKEISDVKNVVKKLFKKGD